MSVDVQARAAAASDTMLPYRVVRRTTQTHDTVTLTLEPVRRAAGRFRAGQFMMLYSFGVGEIAISISGDPAGRGDVLEHTIRTVGAVSGALRGTGVGGLVGVRGPFGTGWDVESAAGETSWSSAGSRGRSVAAVGARRVGRSRSLPPCRGDHRGAHAR